MASEELPKIDESKIEGPQSAMEAAALPGIQAPPTSGKSRAWRHFSKQARKAYVPQREQRDCGVACLATVIRYHGGDARLERLREISGTDRQGTTLLGLYQAGPQLGLDMEGMQADSLEEFDAYLAEHPEPIILNILKHGRFMHFVVCFGKRDGKYLIADPDAADGPALLSPEELEQVWQIKACLALTPNADFVPRQDIRRDKLRWIKELVRDDLNVLGIALFLGLALAIIGMATAVFSQKLIDDILPSADTGLLITSLALLGFIIVVQSLLGYVRSYFLMGQSRDFNNRIINRFYGSLLHLPKSFFDSRKVGEMVARMNDTARIQGTVQTLFTSVAISILQVIAAIIFLFVYDAGIGWVAMLSLPIYFGLMYAFNEQVVRRQRQVMQAYAMNESNYVDTIQGIAAIKAGNREGIYGRVTRFIYGRYQDLAFDLGKLGIRLGLIGGIVGAGLNMGIISWAAYKVLTGDMELGVMMAILQISGMLLPSVQSLASVIIQLQEANVAFDRMYEFASIEPEYEEEGDAAKIAIKSVAHLEVRDLTFRFPGRSHLLKAVGFEVRKGEMVAIMGESGCGKSTLLQILQQFYHPESGTLTVNGHAWDSLSVRQWRNQLGVVPQDIKIFNGSLLDNIAMGKSPTGVESNPEMLAREIIRFCEDAGLDEFFQNFPQGYFTMLGEEGVNISGGQRQLVALARALYQQPSLLLLDEATSAMDRATEAKVLAGLRARKEEMAIIFVTHRIKTAARADRIYVIESGAITAHGSHQDLMQSDNFYSLSWKDLHSSLEA